jgi:hypothetical protein
LLASQRWNSLNKWEKKMKSKYLNNLIEDSLFTRMASGVTKVVLVALIGTVIGVGVYGCKKF